MGKKGKFAKLKVVQGRENNLKSISRTRKLKSQIKCLFAQANEKKVAHSRRVMEMDTLAAEMWCKRFEIPLSFANVSGEVKKGLASVLNITCIKCKDIHSVHTNEYNPVNNSYEVNGKLAFGVIDAGVGESHINTIVSAIDVPIVSPTTLKKYERQVGIAIKEVAQESCLKAVRLERQKTLQNEPTENKILVFDKYEITLHIS